MDEHTTHSKTYFEIQSMIEKNWLVKSMTEFDQMLQKLEQEGEIETAERISLIELYTGRDNSSLRP